MRRLIRNIEDVTAHQLCCGCGACAYISPDRIEMIDSLAHGRRPCYKGTPAAPPDERDALTVCPGVDLAHALSPTETELIAQLRPGWGPVLELWEGHATDEAIRFAGSSGGAATAIALACIERGGMHGAVHVTARPDAPLLNHTVLSTTRTQLMEATGSRYAPASPCDGLHLIQNAPAPCVFIGKPCDVAAVDKACRLRAALQAQIGLTISIFCAGTPSTRATLRLLEHMGVTDPDDVVALRYRGLGWPGDTTVTIRTTAGLATRSLSYRDAWGRILSRDRQWRCHVCADHTGEFADIALGDPWHRPVHPDDKGSSLIVVRTERGRRALRSAIEGGHLVITRVDPRCLPASQPALLRARGAVWGRLLACRMLGIPAPRYRGFPMFRFWVSQLSLTAKVRSIVGTIRRIFTRGLISSISLAPRLDAQHPQRALPLSSTGRPTTSAELDNRRAA
jgi:coenzyme F420 hydrogenase subunit beta